MRHAKRAAKVNHQSPLVAKAKARDEAHKDARHYKAQIMAQALVYDPDVQAAWLKQLRSGTMPMPLLLRLLDYACGAENTWLQPQQQEGLTITIHRPPSTGELPHA